jgi:hypothetical protein
VSTSASGSRGAPYSGCVPSGDGIVGVDQLVGPSDDAGAIHKGNLSKNQHAANAGTGISAFPPQPVLFHDPLIAFWLPAAVSTA